MNGGEDTDEGRSEIEKNKFLKKNKEMNMRGIVKGLVSESEPKIQNWGEKRHVPVNIRQEKTTDEEGNEKTIYVYDVVERVEQPVTVDSIVAAGVKATFTEHELSHIMTHFARENDKQVTDYKAFVTTLTEDATKSGYE